MTSVVREEVRGLLCSFRTRDDAFATAHIHAAAGSRPSLRLPLGPFTRAGIVHDLGEDIPDGVRTVLTDYLDRLESGDETTPFPRFRRGRLRSRV